MKAASIILAILFAGRIGAQELPPFKLLRYEEDYSLLANDSSRKSTLKRMKYVAFGDKRVYLSVGGEIRYQFCGFWDEDWGRENVVRNLFLLQRYHLHADVHLAGQIRIFGQLRSGIENGRSGGARPIDEDKLNLHQLFADISVRSRKLTARLGRQEINYGTGRLLSVREGPNLRQSFDGIKAIFSGRRFWLHAFLFSDIETRPGVFDNRSLREANLWGGYASRNLPAGNGSTEFYYLGILRNHTEFEEGVGRELRHSLGLRHAKRQYRLSYDLEAVWQWGRFSGKQIQAWTASSDFSYTFPLPSTTGLTFGNKVDIISGDRRKGDERLQSFNPLYPKAGYFGFDPILGAVNLIDVHPYMRWQMRRNLSLEFDLIANWRYSLQDGSYRPSGEFNFGGSLSRERYIGTDLFLKGIYEVNRHLTLESGLQYFIAGPFVNDAGGNRNAMLTSIKTTIRY